MVKRAAKPSEETRQTVGIDIGYGVTKVATANTQVSFPSVWGAAREVKFRSEELAAKYPGDQVSDTVGRWFVGDLALSQLPGGLIYDLRGRSSDDDMLGNSARIRFLQTALGKLYPAHHGDVIHFEIATGLPVDHMRNAAAFKAALMGTHLIQTDTAEFVANIANVYVMPQPYGTLYANSLTANGRSNRAHTASRTGVIDIGTFTVDAALDVDGEYIDALSGSVETGVYIVRDAIAAQYEADHQQKPHYSSIETILKNKCIKVRGQMWDYGELVEEASNNLRMAVLRLMNDRWERGANVDVIYVSGGGAALVYKAIKGAYPQAVLTDNPQMANAQGYLQYALFARSE